MIIMRRTCHGGRPVLTETLWSEEYELFVESPPIVAGRENHMLLHVTVLDDFSALDNGTLTIELDGPAKVSGEASAPVQSRDIEINSQPPLAGNYQGEFRSIVMRREHRQSRASGNECRGS